MSALIELLARLDASHEVWAEKDRVWSAGEIRQQVQECKDLFRQFSGSRVVLELSDTRDALVWMLALDGQAKAVFLVPPTLKNTDDYTQLKRQFNANMTINEVQVAQWKRRLPVQGAASDMASCNTEWVLATSGTTGTPKLAGHYGSALIRTAKKDADRGKEFVWGLIFEAFRFAGLQVVLQALAGGSRLLICDPRAPAQAQAEWLRRAGVNALSATPTYWRKLLMSALLEGHCFRQITLGGEPADQSIMDALKTAFPAARISHIYASTEAGTAFSVTDGRAGFPVEYLRHGVSGRALAIGSSGTLRIEPVSSEQPGHWCLDETGFIDTGDLVEVRGDRVCFVGRSSGAINVGGNKVIPEQVEAVIRSVAGVADVLVKANSSSVTGQLVVADVVPQSADFNTIQLRKAIIGHCKVNLERYKVPALIRFVEQIDANSSGKASRV